MARRCRDVLHGATMIVGGVLLHAYPLSRAVALGVAASMLLLVAAAIHGYLVTVSPRGDFAQLIAGAGGPLAMIVMAVPHDDHEHMGHHASMPTSEVAFVLTLLAITAVAGVVRRRSPALGHCAMCVGMALPVLAMLGTGGA